MLVRLWKMEYIPFQNDGDELAFVFTGLSLFDLGFPVSWSSFEYGQEYFQGKYELGDVKFNTKETFTMVGPWFDNPFLLSVIQGAWLKTAGYSFPVAPPSLVIRLPMLVAAGFTLFFVFRIAQKIFGFYPALLSLIIMGFSPSLILGQRMVATENIYIPLTLMAIYHLLFSKKKHIIVLVLLTVLAALAKFPGFICLIIIASYFLINKEYKKMVIYVVASIALFLVIYLSYVSYFDFQHFLTALEIQSHRLVGWHNPFFIFSHPGFLNFVMPDFSYYLIIILGMIEFFSKSSKKSLALGKIAVLTSLIMIWATSGAEDMLGWYKLPLFTFLSILAAGAVKKERILSLFALLVITVLNNFGLIYYPEIGFPRGNVLRSALIIFFVFYLSLHFLRKKTKKNSLSTQSIFLISILTIYIGYSFYFAHNYYFSLCKDKTCKIPSLTLKTAIENRSLKPE